MLELPQQLKEKQHEPNDNGLLPTQDAQAFYNMGNPDDAEWLVNEITTHQWMGNKIEHLGAQCKDL